MACSSLRAIIVQLNLAIMNPGYNELPDIACHRP